MSAIAITDDLFFNRAALDRGRAEQIVAGALKALTTAGGREVTSSAVCRDGKAQSLNVRFNTETRRKAV
jgi:hypothetical protein